MGKKKSVKFANSGGFWARYKKTPNGCWIGSGQMTTESGKKLEVSLYFNPPKEMPKALMKEAKSLFEELSELGYQLHEKAKKKGKKMPRAIFNFSESKSQD